MGNVSVWKSSLRRWIEFQHIPERGDHVQTLGCLTDLFSHIKYSHLDSVLYIPTYTVAVYYTLRLICILIFICSGQPWLVKANRHFFNKTSLFQITNPCFHSAFLHLFMQQNSAKKPIEFGVSCMLYMGALMVLWRALVTTTDSWVVGN